MEFFTNLHYFGDLGLLALRIALGTIFIVHGMKKRVMWKMQPSAQLSGNMLWILRALSICEPLGGVAAILGFLTPFAAMGFSLVMIGAIYSKIMVWHTPFMGEQTTGWEFDLLILAASLLLLFMGGGFWSLDNYFFWDLKGFRWPGL